MPVRKTRPQMRDNKWSNVCKTYARERVGECPCQRDCGICEGRRGCKPIRSDDVEPNRHRYGSGLGLDGREDRQDQPKRRYVLGKPLRGIAPDLGRELKQWQVKHQVRGHLAAAAPFGRRVSPASPRAKVTKARRPTHASVSRDVAVPKRSAMRPAAVVADCGADAHCNADEAEGEVKIAGVPREVGDAARHENAERRRRQAVQQLGSRPRSVGSELDANSAARTGSAPKPTSSRGTPAAVVGVSSDPRRNKRDHELWHDYEKRDEFGRVVGRSQRDDVRDERENCRVREVKKTNGGGQDQQRSVAGETQPMLH